MQTCFALRVLRSISCQLLHYKTQDNDKLSIRSINVEETASIENSEMLKQNRSPWCHCFLFLMFGLACREVIDCKITYISSSSSSLPFAVVVARSKSEMLEDNFCKVNDIIEEFCSFTYRVFNAMQWWCSFLSGTLWVQLS